MCANIPYVQQINYGSKWACEYPKKKYHEKEFSDQIGVFNKIVGYVYDFPEKNVTQKN